MSNFKSNVCEFWDGVKPTKERFHEASLANLRGAIKMAGMLPDDCTNDTLADDIFNRNVYGTATRMIKRAKMYATMAKIDWDDILKEAGIK